MERTLNLGCGNVLAYGAINVDINRPTPRVLRPPILKPGDLTQVVLADAHNLPFRDDSFDLIQSSHTLEHVRDLLRTIAELHRVAKPRAIFELTVPYYKHETAFSDPTHVRFFTEYSFDYWASNPLRYSHTYQAGPKERFWIESVEKQNVGRFRWHVERHCPGVLRPLARRLLGHETVALCFHLTKG